MASIHVMSRTVSTQSSCELAFAGDGVRLSGQLDYPASSPNDNGYPLLFILHSAGWNIRRDYAHYARLGLSCGYAVFRWDKRGTGKSGAGGQGSTTRDAILAYETALEQPDINRDHVVILAQSEGTLLLAEVFAQFAAVQHPIGVILASSMVNPDTIHAIDSRVQIILGEKDWNDWKRYARDACATHNTAYRHGASFYVAHNADRKLLMHNNANDNRTLHFGVNHIMRDWLQNL